MTKQEWIGIGYQNGIINQEDHEEIRFKDAYQEWFLMKMKTTKPPTVDRIEVTFNKYYKHDNLIEKYISTITDADIIAFYTRICAREPLTDRQLGRISQIMKSVLLFMRDLDKGGCPLHDWDKIKRNIPQEKIQSEKKTEYAIDIKDVEYIMHQVIDHHIYERKQSACLCVCMNFYLGLRIGELAALTFEDFNFKKMTVSVRDIETKYYERDANGERIGVMQYDVVHRTKTRTSTREIPLVPEVVYIYDLIKKHHETQGYHSEYLAFDGTQTILTRSLDRTIRKLVQLCEAKYFSSHKIRKTFATILHHNGVPTRVISDLMGHTDISTTEKCYILSYEESNEKYLEYMKASLNYSI